MREPLERLAGSSSFGRGDRFHLMEHSPDTQFQILSRAAERNLTVAMELRATAWELAAAGLRTFRPELSEAEVQAEVRLLFLKPPDLQLGQARRLTVSE